MTYADFTQGISLEEEERIKQYQILTNPQHPIQSLINPGENLSGGFGLSAQSQTLK
jgi:hypothetical protein